MNFKERIELINQLKKEAKVSSVEIKKDFDETPFFVSNNFAEQIIKNALLKDKNIVLVMPASVDKTLVAKYIRGFVAANVTVEVIRNFSENLPYASAEKLIIPEPSIKEITKIFELILCDYRNFIFSVNLKTFENVLESFRTILALANPNLTSNNIEHLIGVASPLFVYVDRNNDGLFDITNVAKAVYERGSVFVESLYSSQVAVPQEDDSFTQSLDTTQQIEEIFMSKEDESEIENESINIIDSQPPHLPSIEVEQVETIENIETVEQNAVILEKNEVQEVAEDSNEKAAEVIENEVEQQGENVSTGKINKYKLLKEKVRSKKQ